jgi:hypothetical protein
MHPEREIAVREIASASDRGQNEGLAREHRKSERLHENRKQNQIDRERGEIHKPEACEVSPPAAANVEDEPTLCHERFQHAYHVSNDQIE